MHIFEHFLSRCFEYIILLDQSIASSLTETDNVWEIFKTSKLFMSYSFVFFLLENKPDETYFLILITKYISKVYSTPKHK